METRRMTLKQAAEFLKTTNTVFKLSTIKKAVISGRLRARLEKSAPISYYTVLEADLLLWATNAQIHKPGRR